ncbi:sarcosine oxidase subunit gamma [Ancylobacter sp. TS-1]|uniref:sarcosine oxidase subunit gamma n=1 Tax=Ancylobacter sp. TS-1 TaxID=1850374 RepID=UPI001265D542|nr:sarcosine oxidase subunit gamma family protein [Ancylobacter sp. TS-1]QFR34799.1 sarcosine oxidase subunit gamma [Ancylobacter sp. TS-1]
MSDPLNGLAFDRVPPAGAYGIAGEPGILVSTTEEPFIALAVARNGFGASVAERLGRAFGGPGADRPHAGFGSGSTVVGTGPGRFFVLSRSEADIAGTLRAVLGSEAAVTEQGDAFVLFELSGARVPDLLAKGAPVDLDPRVFQVGDAATTLIAHIGATLWRSGAASWRVLVARSYEASFTRFLIGAGAEYGLRLEGRG